MKTDHIQPGAVTTDRLADGAVTDAKIAGPISPSKIPSAGLSADMLDGLHAGSFSTVMHGHEQVDVLGLPEALAGKASMAHDHPEYAKKYANVIVVSADGLGDFTNPVDAVASITDASPTNRYLIKIMPGVYDITGQWLYHPSYVDLEGSGRGTTRIIRRFEGQAWTGVVNYSESTSQELRNLTIEATAPLGTINYSDVRALTVFSGTPRISNVELISSIYSTDYHNATVVTVLGVGPGPTQVTFENVFMDVIHDPALPGLNSGLYTNNASGELPEVRLWSTRIRVNRSASNTHGFAVVPIEGRAIIRGFGAQIEGFIDGPPGVVKCVACFDASYSPLSVP